MYRKKISKMFFRIIVTIILTLGFSWSLQSVLAAWVQPTASPPDGNQTSPVFNDAGLLSFNPDVYAFIDRSELILSGNLMLAASTDCTYLYTDDSGNVKCSTSAVGGETVTANNVESGTFTGDYILDGSFDITGSLQVEGLTNCDTIDTDASGNFVCGTDASGLGAISADDVEPGAFTGDYEISDDLEIGGDLYVSNLTTCGKIYTSSEGRLLCGSSYVGASSVGAGTFSGNFTFDGNVGVTGYLYSSNSYYNLSLGYGALAEAINNPSEDSQHNTAVGFYALNKNYDDSNVAVGAYALADHVSGRMNVAVGNGALRYSIGGERNIAIGSGAMATNDTGISNVAVGDGAMNLADTGNYNTSVGGYSLMYHHSGDSNTAIGWRALGRCQSGEGNVALGSFAGYNWIGDNRLFIDNSDTDSPLIGGDFTLNRVYVNGVLAHSSDIRLKKEISTLEDSLDKVLKLRGVDFTWKESGKKDIGLIAQEVEEVFPELVTIDDSTSENYKSIEYSNLVAPLIEAVKEQQVEIETMQKQIDELNLLISEFIK